MQPRGKPLREGFATLVLPIATIIINKWKYPKLFPTKLVSYPSSFSPSLCIRDLRSPYPEIPIDLHNFSTMASQVVYGLLFLSFSFTCIMLLHLVLHPVFYFTSWNLVSFWSFDYTRSIDFNQWKSISM